MHQNIEKLLTKQLVWRGQGSPKEIQPKITSDFPRLDQAIGGWSYGTIVELIHQEHGNGEISLIIPLIKKISNAKDTWIVLVDPPYIPYAPSFVANNIDLSKILIIEPKKQKESIWAMEQALGTNTCSIVIGWPKAITEQIIRKFKMAARRGNTIGFYLVKPNITLKNSSVSYKIQVSGKPSNIEVTILKTPSDKKIKPFFIKHALALL